MATPTLPAQIVEGGKVKVMEEMKVLDAFRTRMCAAAEKLRWTRGYEDLQHELYHQVISLWAKGTLQADMLARVETETRRRAIDSRDRLGKRVLELQRAGEFLGITHHFPAIFPDTIHQGNAAWELGFSNRERPLRWTDSWDQASNPELAHWARHCEALAQLYLVPAKGEKAEGKPANQAPLN